MDFGWAFGLTQGFLVLFQGEGRVFVTWIRLSSLDVGWDGQIIPSVFQFSGAK